MKYFWLFLWIVLPCFVVGQQTSENPEKYVTERWEKFPEPEHKVVESVLSYRDHIEKYIRKQGEEVYMASLENGSMALDRIATLLKSGKLSGVKSSLLKKVLAGINLKDKEVIGYSRLDLLMENYFAVDAIREGAPVDRAWGSMWFNTSIETVGNEYDYQRYRRVLELNNPDLTLAYLSCLKDVFRYNGYTKGLEELRPYVEKYMPESELKQEIFGLYDYYYHLREGAEAPLFTLKDYKGREYALSGYKGKVLVIDVWATWCGGCIANLPKFMAMREKYKDREDVEFITISIDDVRAFNSWKYALPRLKLMEVTNLLAPKEGCDFQDRYNITGIPRYMLMDKEGKIVTVYAPSPGKDFERLIEETLAK